MKSVCLGLTGSIAMGKTTTAKIFAEFGVPVWDADATVHRLYGKGGAAVAPLASLVPDALRDSAIDRKVLSEQIQKDTGLLSAIETIVHPLTQSDREVFLIQNQNAAVVLFDIPLLFETGADAMCDQIVVVTAPADVQRARALSRPGMTEARFEAILARQTPDAEKRTRADHVIDTSQGLEPVRLAVQSIIEDVTPIGADDA